MLTSLRVKNFKGFSDAEIELGRTVLFVGPSNSGKTAALQALALWETGLRKWLEKQSAGQVTEVTIGRRDLVSVPIPSANLLWRDLHTPAGPLEIAVSGVSGNKEWHCGFEFHYANEESFYCRLGGAQTQAHEAAASIRVAFLPAMSGLAATEDRLDSGSIDVRIGEGRTAEVLRNLCYRISSRDGEQTWEALVQQIDHLFGVRLNAPLYIKERGQITMSYREGAVELDVARSGRGLQQTLLLLALLYTHPNSVLLLDEPDAHLEILRQRQIYHVLTDTAERNGCQVIAASHSEVILEEAADRDIVVAFVGKPHRIDDRGSQVLKSLRAIGFDQYYQAEQTGWVLYLEGSTDLAILRAFAERLQHPAAATLARPFVHYVGNLPQKARDHFFGLREAKRDLVGIALYDSLDRDLPERSSLVEMKWERREIANYLAYPETLLAYAENEFSAVPAMEAAVSEVSAARKTLRKPDPFSDSAKASDDCLDPIFSLYFEKLALPNLMQKTDYHALVKFVPEEMIASEITTKLDEIDRVARTARPLL
ncbi:MAG: AAA family ATPase [Bryobacteraceae bacterium]